VPFKITRREFLKGAGIGIVAADRSLDLTQKVIDQLKAGGGS